VPTAGAVTSTCTVQLPPGPIVPFENASDGAPAVGANVGEPHPVVDAFGVGAISIAPGAVGSTSLNATLEIVSFGFGLTTVSVNRLTPPAMIGDGEKLLASCGGDSAVSVALATLAVFVPVSVVDRNPLTLLCGPAVVAVTLTPTEHEPLAGIVPPLNVSDVAPAVGAQVPPQVEVAVGVAATCVPAGSASLNAAPVSATEFVLASVNVNVEMPFTAIGLGTNDFVIVAGVPLLHPVKITSSSTGSEPALVLFELKK